jgi:TrkA domain protein
VRDRSRRHRSGPLEEEERVEVEETPLPGIGLRHDLVVRAGQRLGVVSQVNGDRELVLYDREDPDACLAVVRLTPDEAGALAELLGAPKIMERLARLREQVEGITTERVVLSETSPYAGRTLGDTRMRTRTGVSVVAILRDGEVVPSPSPAYPMEAGDKLILVGTNDGIANATHLLQQG